MLQRDGNIIEPWVEKYLKALKEIRVHIVFKAIKNDGIKYNKKKLRRLLDTKQMLQVYDIVINRSRIIRSKDIIVNAFIRVKNIFLSGR